MKKIKIIAGVVAIFAALLTQALLTTALAETFPSRPITIIVPFAAGGPIDTTTRIVAEKMRETLGQTVLVENLGGAAGSLAAARLVKAEPDGYTLMTGVWGTHVANAAIYKLAYDVQADFTPIALLSSNPLLIVSSKKTPATNLKELITWLKANPDKATQGTSGVGSVGEIGGVFFENITGTKFRFIPYRGLAPAMTDLIAGNVDLMFDTPATSLPQVKAGTIRAYAVTSKTRIASAPDVPTVDEAGVPNLYISTWTAFFSPKGTPADLVAKLSAATMAALADPTVKKRLADVGQDIYPPAEQTSAYLAKFQDEELKKWTPIIKAAGIKVE
jgi:tripartite-type tricarboxylate transporter receptor subunit TctC